MKILVSDSRSRSENQRVAATSERSSWRLVIGLAFVGCVLSIYLALFQYGYLTRVWDPLFRTGSEAVLLSGLLDPISRLVQFRVHDAALGAMAYGLEFVLALACSRSRANSRHWLFVAYPALVLSLGLTSLGLVILQAVVIKAWCLLCLVSAAISGVILLISRREIARATNFLFRWWSRNQPRRPSPGSGEAVAGAS